MAATMMTADECCALLASSRTHSTHIVLGWCKRKQKRTSAFTILRMRENKKLAFKYGNAAEQYEDGADVLMREKSKCACHRKHATTQSMA